MNCLKWPLNSQLKVVNKDGTFDGSSTQFIFMGPSNQPTNTQLAWLILSAAFSYNTPLIPTLTVTPFYQSNNSTQKRDTHLRCTLGQGLGNSNNIFPIVGQASVQQAAAGPVYTGRPTPLYVPFPDELILAVTNGTAGVAYQFRAVVLEVATDVDISGFL